MELEDNQSLGIALYSMLESKPALTIERNQASAISMELGLQLLRNINTFTSKTTSLRNISVMDCLSSEV